MTKWLLLLALLFSFETAAQSLKLAVKEPFLNIHSGAGRGYPIIYVAEKTKPLRLLSAIHLGI